RVRPQGSTTIRLNDNQTLRLAARAALSRAKSSPAWWEERVSGDEETSRKPFAPPIAAYSANSSGVTKRWTAWCFGVGCRYWPMVRKSTSAERMSSIICNTSARVSPSPTITPDLDDMRSAEVDFLTIGQYL